ncbi:FtsX-like permease family protein [Paenibacillus sp. 1P03SA]|uniref:FtsX-like permease family protein n=1 Tax=Paenibacillus sp. 1P03SA TaxID=3132294 RepID=UPI00399F27D1
MNFRQFAFNNIVRNKRTYIAHFLSSAFSVMIFFTYALLLFHPDLQGELSSTSATISHLSTMGMRVSQVLIFIFSFFFLLYSVSSFLKNRKKEFGLLMVLGISRKQLKQLIFLENMMIGVAAIAAGIGTGLIFAKLILLISSKVLYIMNGLPFYLPVKAALTTTGAFLLLFLLISFFTAGLGKSGPLVDLLQSEDKPKPEPKASVSLSLLALALIAAGYGCVFYFTLERAFLFSLLGAGVILTVAGTYFLFTQLSVYVIGALKRRERLFFNKTNLLTLSELSYRMKDNAIMFFMVAIVSAVAFTGIGTSLAISDPGLSEMQDPYAFKYISLQNNPKEKEHVQEIRTRLEDARYSYKQAVVTPFQTENAYTVLKLSEYNKLADMLGYEKETIEDDSRVIISPHTISEKNDWDQKKPDIKTLDLVYDNQEQTLNVQKITRDLVLPLSGRVAVVTDTMFGKLPVQEYQQTYYLFVVEGWEKSAGVSRVLADSINDSGSDGSFYFEALVHEWLSAKQKNGILLIVSVLVGIVFFTFAASFVYFRLYADLERDEKQYRMIAKVGLSRKELRRILTRQLLLMFFLPIAMALVHSAVALTALQLLVGYSILQSSLTVFLAFLTVQAVYFLMVRWRYLQHLYRKIASAV